MEYASGLPVRANERSSLLTKCLSKKNVIDLAMPEPSVKRIYQSADEAIELIHAANRRGESLTVTKHGDIALSKATTTHPVMLWFRKTFGNGVHEPATQDSALKAILATKMKIDLASASVHTSKQLRKYFNAIERASSDKSLNDLCTAWTTIKNKIRLRDMRREDNLLVFNAQQAGTGMSAHAGAHKPSDLAPTAPLLVDPAMERLKGHAGESVTEPDSNPAMHASPGTAQSDSAAALDACGSPQAEATQETPPSSPQAVVTHPAAMAVDDKTQTWIDNINQALPTSMVFKGEPGEIVTAILTLPDSEHRELYATLENTELGPEPENEIPPGLITDDMDDDEPYAEASFDESSRIARQTLKDCGRAEFHLIDADGFCEIFDVGAGASEVSKGIIGFGRNARGLSLETGSRLINQEALGALYVPLLMRFRTKTGDLFRFNKTVEAEPRIPSGTAESRTPKLSMNLFKWAWLPDGSAEFEMVQREKIHNVLLDDVMIPVNRDTRWQGDISDDNFGYEFRAKIRIAAEDMRKGKLENVTVIEPLSMTFRIAPGAMDSVHAEDDN